MAMKERIQQNEKQENRTFDFDFYFWFLFFVFVTFQYEQLRQASMLTAWAQITFYEFNLFKNQIIIIAYGI